MAKPFNRQSVIKEFLVDGNVIAMPEDLIEYINYFDKLFC